MPSAKPSKATISNAIAAAQAAGLTPTSIRIGADGSLTIDITDAELNNPANDVPAKTPKKWGQGSRHSNGYKLQFFLHSGRRLRP